MFDFIQDIYQKVFTTPAKKAAAGNFLFLTYSTLLGIGVSLLSSAYLIRVIGPEKFGILSFAQAFIQYFIFFTDYSFNLTATREIAIHREDRRKVSEIFSAVMSIKMIFLALSLAAFFFILGSFEKFQQNQWVYIVTLGSLVGNALIPTFLFQGMEKMNYILFCNLFSFLFIMGLFYFVKQEQDFLYAPLLISLGALAGGIFAQWAVRSRFKILYLPPKRDEIKHQLKEGWEAFVSLTAVSSHHNSRVFAMGIFSTHQQTAYFAIAERMMTYVITFPLSILAQVVYPRLSKIFSEDSKEGFRLTMKFQKAATIFYALAMPLCFIFAPALVKAFSGSTYQETVLSFRILTVAVFLIALHTFRLQFFLIAQKRDRYMKICVTSGIFGFFGTFLSAYFFSYMGISICLVFLAILGWGLTVRELRLVTAERKTP